MPRFIWLDGRLVDAAEPHLHVTDRGFQLGDGVFETARARRGVAIEIDEHLERLRHGADVLGLSIPMDDDRLIDAIGELLAAEGLDGLGASSVSGPSTPGDAAVRITVSRGPIAARGLLPGPGVQVAPTVAIQAWPHVPPSPELVAHGLRVIHSAIRHDPSSPLAGTKSISRAEHVFARLEAHRAGADDALFLTSDGSIAEATSANLFVIDGRLLRTPPLSSGILAGTTRTWLLRHAGPLGYDAAEAELRAEDLLAAEEAVLCSSVSGVMPIASYDGQPVGSGRSGPKALAIRLAREDWIEAMSLAALMPSPD